MADDNSTPDDNSPVEDQPANENLTPAEIQTMQSANPAVPPQEQPDSSADESDDDDNEDEESAEPTPSSATPPPSALPPTPGLPPLDKEQVIKAALTPTQGQLDDQAVKMAQDVANGQIHQKTISDLFYSQDTPGKLGLAISMLLGGIGSGLTHTPNSALTIMDNIINKDFEQQRLNKESANTFLSTAYQHRVQEAQRDLLEAQARGVPISNAEIVARTNKENANTELLDQNNAMNALNLMGGIGTAQGVVDRMPPGSMQQQQAQQYLDNVIKPHFYNKVQANNANTANLLNARERLTNAGNNKPSTPQKDWSDTGVDLDKMQNLIKQGQLSESSPLKGFVGLTGDEAQAAKQETSAVQDNRASAKIFADSYAKLNSLTAGRLTPYARETEIGSIGPAIARSTTGTFSPQEAQVQARGLFPEVGDTPAMRREKFNKAMDFFKSREAGAQTLQRYGLIAPFPKLSPTLDSNEGRIVQDKAGNRQIWHNGKWQPVTGNP
jgi:hypothetical protein